MAVLIFDFETRSRGPHSSLAGHVGDQHSTGPLDAGEVEQAASSLVEGWENRAETCGNHGIFHGFSMDFP